MSEEDLTSRLGKLARAQADAPEVALPPDAEAALRNRLLAGLQQASPQRPSRRRGLWLSAGIAGVAAAAALFLLRPAPLGPLPVYESTFEGGQQAQRAESSASANQEEPIVIPPEAHVSFTLRPQTSVSGPIVARAFVQRAGEVRWLRAIPAVSEQGAVRLAGSREQIFEAVPLGAWTLVLIAARPKRMTDDAVALAKLAREPTSGVRSTQRKIILAAE